MTVDRTLAERRRTRRRRWAIALGLVLVLAVPVGVLVARNEPARYDEITQHYKYGSIGAETLRVGIPFWLWYVLPQVFPDLLPARPGNGYERFGFIYESPEAVRPIGISLRQLAIPTVGLNCASCHAGIIRDAPDAPRQIVLGMPSHQVDLQAYARFIFATGRDPRFNAQTMIDAIVKANPSFSAWDRFFYGNVVIPWAKRELVRQEPNYAWQNQRAPWGPGRVDTFNPYKILLNLPIDQDDSVGTADLPSFYNQRAREGMALHWDGNNTSTSERNKSAALGAGCTESSIDLDAIKRVEDWVWELQPPPMARSRIDAAAAARGAPLFTAHCASCHAPTGPHVGTVIDIESVGTDPERMRSFDATLAERMNTLGRGRPWAFSRFRQTNGYVASLLDGVWLRAPYLHNGSVPTLRDLLSPASERPTSFYRGYEVYDYENVGFITSGPQAAAAGVLYRTDVKGNSNSGHEFGTTLSPAEKRDLLEYLKGL